MESKELKWGRVGMMKTITTELLLAGTKRCGDRRRMTSLQRQAELRSDYAASGLSMAAFARREGLRPIPGVCFVGAGASDRRPGNEVGQPTRPSECILRECPTAVLTDRAITR